MKIVKIKKRLRQFIDYLKRVKLPFSTISVYDFLSHFYIAISEGNIGMKASSVAYSFYMSIFPCIIFFFTLIPYLPVADFQDTLYDILQNLIPPTIWKEVDGAITDVITIKHSGLMSFGFIFAFYFATSGVSSLINSLNSSHFADQKRTWIKQQIIAIFLLAIVAIMLVIVVVIIAFSSNTIHLLFDSTPFSDGMTVLFHVLKWSISFILLYFIVASIYYFSPFERKEYRFFSMGAIVTTILLTASMIGFNYYALYFARYNALYGSVGTVLLFLFWIYLNAFIIISGFEINTTLRYIKLKREVH